MTLHFLPVRPEPSNGVANLRAARDRLAAILRPYGDPRGDEVLREIDEAIKVLEGRT
jgi:hypothetical protein